MISRREMIAGSGALAVGAAISGGLRQALAAEEGAASARGGADGHRPVITPNGSSLPWKMVDGAKEYRLVANTFKHEFAPGLVANCWGYNGQTPGPTIEAVEGDRVRIFVTNELPEPTTVHWHGLYLPCGMDGVSGLNQRPIRPGETFRYEFTLRQHGTVMYHPHHNEMLQQAMGMMGMIVIHPKTPDRAAVDRDFSIMLGEWDIPVGQSTPNPRAMNDFNILTMNSKAFPGTAPLVAKRGDRVRVRFGNLSAMDHHPIHLHGYQFTVTARDGATVQESARYLESTVLVPVATTRDIEFVATEPGDWAFHCHMTHHVMNQMGHDFPNMVGVRPGEMDALTRPLLPDYMTMGVPGEKMMKMPVPKNSIPMLSMMGPYGSIGMGGMFTILKVRENLASYEDPGWYEYPAGTQAELVESGTR